MLALLKPWHDLSKDLKQPHQAWEEVLEGFLNDTSWKEKHVVSGLQYFHECSSPAAVNCSNQALDSTTTQQWLEAAGDNLIEHKEVAPL